MEWLETSFERYDLEVEDNHNFLAEGVVVHNSNARYVFSDGRMHCGSRTEWKKEYTDYSHVTEEWLRSEGASEEKIPQIIERIRKPQKSRNLWWSALHPTVEEFCRAHPDTVVYGEAYGQVQDLTYGLSSVSFALFDILAHGRWLSSPEIQEDAKIYGISTVPVIHESIPYSFSTCCDLAEGQSLLAPHVREGVVVRPITERPDLLTGRAVLKFVGAGYLERS